MDMHDFSLTRNLLDTALKAAGSKRIVRINFLIGPFCEEREKSIHFYWKDLAKDSPGEGAMLHFEHVPASMKCLDCSGMFSLNEEGDTICEFCHSDHLSLLNGQEVQIEGIELE